MSGVILDLWRGALTTLGTAAAPFLVAALTVGLLTAVLQAATQLQENVLSFVPKLIAFAAVLLIGAPWVLGQLTRFADQTFNSLEQIARRGP